MPFKKRKRFVNDGVEVHFLKPCRLFPGKVQQAADNDLTTVGKFEYLVQCLPQIIDLKLRDL